MNRRNAFLKVLSGIANDSELRELQTTKGTVLIPKEIYPEYIGKKETQNLLRKYGTIVDDLSDLLIPVLTNDIEAVAHSEVYNSENVTDINSLGLTGENIIPIEFEAEVRITKKLLKFNPKNREMIQTLIKKAYVRKEIDYMYNGTEEDAFNEGSLFNRSVVVELKETEPGKQIKAIRDSASTGVKSNARWIINQAALKYVEDIVLPNGEAALKTVESSESGGAKYTLLGFPCDVTDDIKPGSEGNKLFYFGDLSSFFIREDTEAMEILIYKDLYAATNELGFKLYHLMDGKFVYSDLDPTIFKSEF